MPPRMLLFWGMLSAGLIALAGHDRCMPGGGGPSRAKPADHRFRVVEIWDPACLMAVPELAAITDPGEFERRAFEWLAANEARVAADIAAEHRALLVDWWHDPDFADDTPFGATVAILESRPPHDHGGRRPGE